MNVWKKWFKSHGAVHAAETEVSHHATERDIHDPQRDLTGSTQQEAMQMQEELITSANLSAELLKSVLDAAFMDVESAGDNELIVKDNVRVRIRVNKERKDRIRFFVVFGFRKDSKPIDRLECVNRINSEYIMVCASAEGDDILFFRYDLMIDGGLTKKAFVLAVKKFASIPRQAIQEYGSGVVE